MKALGRRRFNLFLAVAFLWGIPMTAFALYVIGGRLLISVDGTIVDRRVERIWSGPHRWSATYTLRRADGAGVTYRTTGSDPEVSRDLPVGVQLGKSRWELGYTVNGERVDDFPIRFYAGIGAAGIVLFLSGLIVGLRVSRRQEGTPVTSQGG